MLRRVSADSRQSEAHLLYIEEGTYLCHHPWLREHDVQRHPEALCAVHVGEGHWVGDDSVRWSVQGGWHAV